MPSVEKDIEEEGILVLSDEQLEILERERELHLEGQTQSYIRNEARQIIKGERSY
jgi:hypothetical protein